MDSRKYELEPIFQPKVVVIHRRPNQGFGFTLRHFIAYPPDPPDDSSGADQKQAMETVFIKEVHPYGPAHMAGLQQGDRLLTVNNLQVAGVPYSTIVAIIKQTPEVLTLKIVPKECDVLQMYYTDIAHNPESNRQKHLPGSLSQNLWKQRDTHVNFNNFAPQEQKSYPFQSISSEQVENNGVNPLYQSNFPPPSNQPILMTRLRKSIEQKEEFLRSPPPFHASNSTRREFFPQMNEVPVPNCDISMAKTNIGLSDNFLKPVKFNLQQNSSHKRDFTPLSSNIINSPPFEAPRLDIVKSPIQSKENFPIKRQFVPINMVQENKSNEFLNKFWSHPNDNNLSRFNCDRIKNNSNISNEVIEKRHSDEFNVVSLLTKRFESGSPVSPDSRTVDRTSLFKGELSRINNIPAPIVNIRKREIEMKTRLPVKGEFELISSKNDPPVFQTPNISKDVEIKENNVKKFEKCDEFQTLSTSHVIRRCKPLAVVDDSKVARRISYLRATGNESEYHSDIPICRELKNNVEVEQGAQKMEQIQNSNNIPVIVTDDMEKHERKSLEGEMSIKTTCGGDKITHSRSWRTCKVDLVDNILRANSRNSKPEINLVEIDVKDFDVAEDECSKRKCVFKLTPKLAKSQTVLTTSDKHPTSLEILFQARNSNELKKWLSALYEASHNGISNNDQATKQGTQLAEPQKIGAITSVQTNLYCEENVQNYETTENEFTQTTTTTSKRKVSQQHKEYTEKEMGSPKSRTWKHLFRKIQGNSSDISSSYSPAPPIGSIGVPLKLCPMSKDNEYVPYLVDLCTKIVESKGLSVKGIYRIPGNKAAISELRDQVNKKDFDFENSINDPKWEDVNVVSSLLKLFIRSLPDALLPSSFYNNFIEADKKVGERRLKELHALLESLPKHSYETLKHIIRHLHRVSKNCEINLMEPKNLAIIFGPSIIRTPDETLEIAVKDMKYQCRIVELFVTQYEYFFESGALPELVENPLTPVACISQHDQTSLLLDNVSKIEQKIHDKESVSSRFIPHLRRRPHKSKSATNSDTHSGESITSLESKRTIEEKPKNDVGHHPDDEQDSIDGSTEQTEDELNTSRISDTGIHNTIIQQPNRSEINHIVGSMSLATVTDALETKLRNIRKSPETPEQQITDNLIKLTSSTSHKRNQTQPLTMEENIPYADESPERNFSFDGSAQTKNLTRTQYTKLSPIYNYDTVGGTVAAATSTNSRISHVHDLQSDDSEVSTTSDPKDKGIISPYIQERYKKRRDYRLFRSASFNCRNYTSRTAQNYSALTKDEKTDMNITKKRQIQNKQNRSIKRRHTLGSPNDYFTITRRTNNDILEVGIRIKNVKKRS